MSEIVDKLQKTAVKSLNLKVQQVLDKHESDMNLTRHRPDVLMRFVDNMNTEFDKLQGKVQEIKAVVDFETLSLVPEEELNAMVAVEGMVAAARNMHLPSFISFNTRLNALFPDIRIDESTNPLDPQQMTAAFSDALNACPDLPNDLRLNLYRSFNNVVFKDLDVLLREANKLMVEHGVIPDLKINSVKANSSPVRRARRSEASQSDFGSFGTVEEESYEPENPELFSMMQNLLHNEPAAAPGMPGQPGQGMMMPQGQATAGMVPAGMVPAGMVPAQQYAIPASMMPNGGLGQSVMQPFQPAPGEKVEMVDQAQLMDILTNIQKTLEQRTEKQTSIPSNIDEIEKVDIGESLGEMLKEGQEEGVITAVDRQSSDIINLVTLLYDAIWQDESVPIPIKELIGRTQITIIKVALSDTTFFNRDDHPARVLLNQIAEAGIGWTEVDNLNDDSLYKKIAEIVTKVQQDYDNEEASFFDKLIKNFRTFVAKEAIKTRRLEQSILKTKERQERLEDINELVSQKITERILGVEIHPFVTELLEKHFHKFMVMLVIKEGPGSKAWKQSINTIDVLLWTIHPHDQTGDKARLETVNPRLLNNLRKALRIAKVDAKEVDALIAQLKEVQDATFPEIVEPVEKPAPSLTQDTSLETKSAIDTTDKVKPGSNEIEFTSQSDSADESQQATQAVVPIDDTEAAGIASDDPAFDQVDALSVGTWVEFSGSDDNQAVRCKLAAKINAIDKFIFVNRQGVKVVEKTRLGLATELNDKTVKIISDGLLFSRAMESVIGNLRVTQHEQQTGSAYQPNASSENIAS